MQPQNRRSSFKTPPSGDKETSQHARREKALEEQKRKRAQRVESSRNLDLFAGLSLDSPDDLDKEPEIVREGVAALATLLPPSSATPEVSMKTHSAAHDKSRKSRKPNVSYANKIMYAELLEMRDDPMFYAEETRDGVESDGLPVDLDSNWVALAPVPQGKRCMAVSNQSAGVPGIVSNTFLKSRLKGRTILTFPSSLPASTILDCILDEGWKTNGILHVLDIIRWKGQELGDCEANFRFWWRDTRLSELLALPSMSRTQDPSDDRHLSSGSQQIFPYPTVFLPVPYHLDLSFPSLLSTIIPLSRSPRHLKIQLPSHISPSGDGMDVDTREIVHSATATAEIHSDGLLLYVSQASYEPGTSPLSSWVPINSYEEGRESPLTLFERLVSRRLSSSPEKPIDSRHVEVEMEQ